MADSIYDDTLITEWRRAIHPYLSVIDGMTDEQDTALRAIAQTMFARGAAMAATGMLTFDQQMREGFREVLREIGATDSEILAAEAEAFGQTEPSN